VLAETSEARRDDSIYALIATAMQRDLLRTQTLPALELPSLVLELLEAIRFLLETRRRRG
jgi:hypothetical protein